MKLLPAWVVALAAALVGALLAGGVQEIRVARVQTDLAVLRVEHAEALRAIETASASFAAAMRATEQEWTARVEQESNDGQTRLDAARRDADAARAAGDSLRADLARYRRAAARAAENPSAAAVGPPAGDAIGVLADLFARADARAGDLAATLDLAHEAGLTCERSYDALRR